MNCAASQASADRMSLLSAMLNQACDVRRLPDDRLPAFVAGHLVVLHQITRASVPLMEAAAARCEAGEPDAPTPSGPPDGCAGKGVPQTAPPVGHRNLGKWPKLRSEATCGVGEKYLQRVLFQRSAY